MAKAVKTLLREKVVVHPLFKILEALLHARLYLQRVYDNTVMRGRLILCLKIVKKWILHIKFWFVLVNSKILGVSIKQLNLCVRVKYSSLEKLGKKYLFYKKTLQSKFIKI